MFVLKSKYSPSGDQKNAISEIVKNFENGKKDQTLWGVTGSGKTFTMANVIENIQKPTLIIAHNKTLAAQLAQEFKEFFPDAAVHYFVSYYDYYQPEAYVSKTDTYIEKEATINEEIDRLRHAATKSLITRKDTIIVASVSCIYGVGDVSAYSESIFVLEVGKSYILEDLLKMLVAIQFKRASTDFKSGMFHVAGDVLEIFPASEEYVYTIEFWGEEVTQITARNHLTGEIYEFLQHIDIFPAKHTVTTKDTILEIIPQIKEELDERLKYFEGLGEVVKHERLKSKTEYDLEMMQEVGYVNGIENYSRYLDGRKPGEHPATLMSYFPKDFLCIVDESHMTIPQIGAMYAGDRARKENLVANGFRLPSALDNRPLKFHEFEEKLNKILYVSATPADYEIEKSISDPTFSPEKFFNFDPEKDGNWQYSEDIRIIPQVLRPTGLLDPKILIKPMEFMVDDITKNLSEAIEKGERMLITTLTKRSSEELTEFLLENGFKVMYLHSEVETIDRLETLKNLREGKIEAIVGVNLLREGLDLPEVSKLAILDADKQGFLRSNSALIQIIGRAARNANGEVSMYVEKIGERFLEKALEDSKDAKEEFFITFGENEKQKLYELDKGKFVLKNGLVISNAMKRSINLTYYRRNLQNAYNEKNGITPTTVFSTIKDIGMKGKSKINISATDKKSIKQEIARLELEMDVAAANMEFEKAAELRDTIIELKRKK